MTRRFYAKFDLELTPNAERRMRTYLENNPQGKHGRHRYSLEEYGFMTEDLSAAFRDYMDRYGFGVHARQERHQGVVA